MNRNNTGIVLMASDGKPFYSVGKAEHREIIPLDQISPQLQDALIASEDKNFYEHGGFSILSTIKALYWNIISRNPTGYGGSTITQQLAKNTLLTSNKALLRKYQELSVSTAIERRYTKDQILEMYLNSIYFGENAFGIEDASKVYFNKKPADLNLAESSMLIGVLPAPGAYSPISGNPKYAKERQDTVLTRMVTNGMITEDQKTAAYDEEIHYNDEVNGSSLIAPHFVETVLAELYEKYGEENVKRSGYQVKTTLDLSIQSNLEQNIKNHINFIEQNGGSNASGVAIDPKTGHILALVGSAEWNNPDWGKVNMANTPRQPGSSFKPIYYSDALAKGVVTPATILSDVPTDFGNYAPQNADRRFRGDVNVRSALSQSLNIPSVEVMEKLGVHESIEASKRLGITTIKDDGQYGLSLALGSAEVSLLQMTGAYAAFANEGQYIKPVSIQGIRDKFDASIYQAPQAVSSRAISPEGAFLISSILSDNDARWPIFGGSLTVPGRSAAVKTGTTDDQRDAWTIGYTPQLAVGIWVGNNDNRAMLNGGSGMAGPIWINTISSALKSTPDTPFVIPGGVVEKPVCYGQEALAAWSGYGTYQEFFLTSALPDKTCTPYEPPKPVEKPEEKPKQDEDSDRSPEPPVDTSPDEDDNNDDETETGNSPPEVRPTPPTPRVPNPQRRNPF